MPPSLGLGSHRPPDYNPPFGGGNLLKLTRRKDSAMRVCLFEDRHVEDLEPLTLTRPAHDLLCGLTSLAAKHWRYFAPCSTGILVRPYLADLQRQQRRGVAVNDLDWLRFGPGPGVAIVGPRERLVIDPTAHLDPMVVVDTSNGPVIVDAEAMVTAFTRLEGPCYIGPHAHVLGAKVRGGTTLGPHCRVGGEVEASIVQGHSNKYHDGFLGHAYVGEWVNLGAGTSNSDLRNDYGDVTVTVGGRLVATGMTKVGCFLGDHTKAGLGTLLNTGTSAGAFCHLLPSGGLLPKYLPSFAGWWNGALVESADLPRLLGTA